MSRRMVGSSRTISTRSGSRNGRSSFGGPSCARADAAARARTTGRRRAVFIEPSPPDKSLLPTARPVRLSRAVKLVIQIPAWDEAEQIGPALAELPRHLAGFDAVETLVVDDGSTDGTAAAARRAGADHVVRLPIHRGLAFAWRAGLDAALRLGADVIVSTDADRQYAAADVETLVAPLLRGEAEIVVGDRGVATKPDFSPGKRMAQSFGSWVVRRASGTEVPDATSGFRALTREAALRLNVFSRMTYTLE